MSKATLILGKRGEDAAINFLKKQGYKVIKRNFKNKLGEIDIVAKDKDTICFVEVKSRRSLNFGYPEESITLFKQRQLIRVALSYLKQYNLLNSPARFDVVSILFNNQDKTDIKIIKNAFSV